MHTEYATYNTCIDSKFENIKHKVSFMSHLKGNNVSESSEKRMFI